MTWIGWLVAVICASGWLATYVALVDTRERLELIETLDQERREKKR